MNYIFRWEKKNFFDNITHIFFYYNWIYYLEDWQVKFVESNYMYDILFFYWENAYLRRTKRSIKTIKYNNTDIENFEKKFKMSLNDKIEELTPQCSTHNKVEWFINKISEEYWINKDRIIITKNCKTFKLEKSQNIALNILVLLKYLNPDIKPNIFFNNNVIPNLDLKDNRSIAFRTINKQNELLNNNKVYDFLNDGTIEISAQELLIIEKHPMYIKYLYWMLIWTIFSNISKSNSHKNVYEKFKKLIWPNQIIFEKNQLVARWFNKNDKSKNIEKVVLLHYFIKFWLNIFLQILWQPQKNTIPPDIKDFFHTHIFHKQLSYEKKLS